MKKFPIAFAALMTACTIEPPLKLSDDPRDITTDLPIVITDLEVLWDVNTDWRAEWYYGWDETDVKLWGELEHQYPDPTSFEVRRYYYGEEKSDKYLGLDKFTIYGKSFRRKYQYGFHNMMLWSNIDSPDGSQTVIINENDPDHIFATTSRTRVNYISQSRTRAVNTHNQPDIFYASYVKDFYVSHRIEDYDYYDEVEKVWVKYLHTQLDPMVYIYLVQVVLHNNKGRVAGVYDECLISGLADGVELQSGETSQVDANTTFDMRLKKDIDCNGERCDVLGGRLTTYGLCGMAPWRVSRSGPNEVTRLDLDNEITLCLLSHSAKQVLYTANVTDQMRAKQHGGVITIHINVDDIDFPETGGTSSGFVPTVEDYNGEESYEFEMQ